MGLRTGGKVLGGGPSEVADCGRGQARLQLADPTRWGLADPVVPHLWVDKLGGTAGEQSRPSNPGLQRGEIKPQTSHLKTPVGVEATAGETPSLTGEFLGETHRGLEHAQAQPPTPESAPVGPNLIVGSGGSD